MQSDVAVCFNEPLEVGTDTSVTFSPLAGTSLTPFSQLFTIIPIKKTELMSLFP